MCFFLGGSPVEIVGSYELLVRLAETNSAQRWRGRDTALGRDVALRRMGTGATATLEQPRTTARLLTGLSHPNIVALLDKIESDGQVWLIDEPADGITLDAVLAGDIWPTPQQSIGIVRGVLQGLAYVHSSRAMHGDIKPSTVLLATNGTARLTDFGVPAPVTPAGTAPAPNFLSPEAATGLGLSARSDVYSVGAVLVLLLRGREGNAGSVNERVRAALERAMARDPTDRYLDAEQFLQALEDAAEATYGEGWLSEASVIELVRVVSAE
jgi:serine/threonine protein kinase